jgi:ribosomal protein S27AE
MTRQITTVRIETDTHPDFPMGSTATLSAAGVCSWSGKAVAVSAKGDCFYMFQGQYTVLAAHKCRYCGGAVNKATDKCVACGAGQVLAWQGGPDDVDGI